MSVKTHDERNIIYLPAPEDWEAIQDRMMELDADVFQSLLEMERGHCKSEVNEEKPDYDYIGFLSYSAEQLDRVLELAIEAKTQPIERKPENWETIQDRVMTLDTEHFQSLLEMKRDHCKYEFDGDKPDYEFLGFLSHSLAQIQIVLELAKDVKTLTKMEMRFPRRTD